MLHLGRAHDAYADVEEQLGNHAQARRVRRGGRSLSAVSFCHHPCLTASVNCANWPNIYICTLDRDCKRHILASVSTWCRYTVISFSSHHRTLQWRKNKYAHRLSQLTSKSDEFKYTSFTALQYTFPMDNVQDCKIAWTLHMSAGLHPMGYACQVSAPSSPMGGWSKRLLLRETKSVPGCLIIFHILHHPCSS